MVGSAYLLAKKFRPYKQRSQTLMAIVHPEEVVLAGRLFHFGVYAEGLLANDADKFPQE